MFAFTSSLIPVTIGSCSGLVCRNTKGVASVRMASAGASRSVPFAPAPESVRSSGLAGAEAEFDPLQLSALIPITWMRESEVKHCRVAMLAFLGTLVQQAVQFPWYHGAPTTLVGAHDYFLKTALAQVLLFTSLFEIVAGTPAAIQTVRGSGRLPGY